VQQPITQSSSNRFCVNLVFKSLPKSYSFADYVFWPVTIQSVLLKILIPQTLVRTPWMGNKPVAGLYLYRTAQHITTRTNIHFTSGIRTHDPSFPAIQRCARLKVRPVCSCCRDSGWLLSVCTDSSTDTVANPLGPWFRLIALLGLGLVKPSTFTETHESEHEHE
jgi:hypothetical protein